MNKIFKFLSNRKNKIFVFAIFIIIDLIVSIFYTLSEQVVYGGRTFDWQMFVFTFLIWIPLCTFMVILTVLFLLFVIKTIFKFVKWLTTK